MNNLALSMVSIAAAGFFALSCSKSDDGEPDQTPPTPAPVPTGSYTYDGATRDIVSAEFMEAPDYYDIFLAPVKTDFEDEPEELINLEYDKKNLGRTLTLEKSTATRWYVRFTRADGAFGYNGISFDEGSIASGTMSLSRNGDGFSLRFDMTFTDGRTLKGEYDGAMTEFFSD